MKDIVEHLLSVLKTPKDISKMSNRDKASIIALYFIGYVAKPTGISDVLLQKCADAFNDNRGKVEKEIESVFKILEGE